MSRLFFFFNTVIYIYKARSLIELKKKKKTSSEKLYSLLTTKEKIHTHTHTHTYTYIQSFVSICLPKSRCLDNGQYYVLNNVLANYRHFKIYHNYAIEKTSRREINTSHCIVFIHVDALCPKYTCSQIDTKRYLFTFI